MKRFLPLIAAAAAVLAFVFWWYSTAQVLKRQSDKLLNLATVAEGSGTGSRQLGGLALNRLLAAEVTLSVEEAPDANGTFSNAELEAAWSAYQRHVKRASFARRGPPRTLVSGSSATVSMNVETLVESSNLRIMEGTRNIVFRWSENKEGDWRLTTAEIRPIAGKGLVR